MKNNEDKKYRKKKEEKLDILISLHQIGFWNFLRFIAFTNLVAFKILLLILCHNKEKFTNL